MSEIKEQDLYFPIITNNGVEQASVFWIPKNLECAVIDIPTLETDSNGDYTLTTKQTSVTRFYVRHHPQGYDSTMKAHGTGSVDNPFLDLTNACEKVDCFLSHTCGFAQIIVAPDCPINEDIRFIFSTEAMDNCNRVIIGTIDNSTFFTLNAKLITNAICVSQCTGKDKGLLSNIPEQPTNKLYLTYKGTTIEATAISRNYLKTENQNSIAFRTAGRWIVEDDKVYATVYHYAGEKRTSCTWNIADWNNEAKQWVGNGSIVNNENGDAIDRLNIFSSLVQSPLTMLYQCTAKEMRSNVVCKSSFDYHVAITKEYSTAEQIVYDCFFEVYVDNMNIDVVDKCEFGTLSKRIGVVNGTLRNIKRSNFYCMQTTGISLNETNLDRVVIDGGTYNAYRGWSVNSAVDTNITVDSQEGQTLYATNLNNVKLTSRYCLNAPVLTLRENGIAEDIEVVSNSDVENCVFANKNSILSNVNITRNISQEVHSSANRYYRTALKHFDSAPVLSNISAIFNLDVVDKTNPGQHGAYIILCDVRANGVCVSNCRVLRYGNMSNSQSDAEECSVVRK